MEQNQMKLVGDNIFNVQTERARLQSEIMELKRQLAETELYKQIQEKEKSFIELQAKEEEMKWQIVNWMLKNNLKSIEFTFQKFTVKKNPWSLIIEDETKIPNEFKTEKITTVIDKKTLKERIQNGEEIEGAKISVSYSLQITPR